MKQFQYESSRTGLTHGPFNEEEVSLSFPMSANGVLGLEAGKSYVDTYGDTWSVVNDDPVVVINSAERLERIATAMMAAIVSKFPADTVIVGSDELDKQHARGAIAYAKALIAELDKVE